MKRAHGSSSVGPATSRGGKMSRLAPIDSCEVGCGDSGGLIDTLPDEMLVLVFSFLSPRDVCNNVAQVCAKWKELHIDPSIYRVFEFKTLQDDLHSKVKYLRIAPWLVSLTLENQVDTTAILEAVCSHNPRLQVLSLKSCRGSLDRENITASTLKKMLRKCPLLQELTVKNCKGFTHLFYRQVGARLPLLKKVHFIRTANFSSEALMGLAENCPELEELRASHKFQGIEEGITTNEDIQFLCSQLGGTLKRLELNGVAWSDQVWLHFSQCVNLTELSVRFALKLTDTGMLVVSCLPNLRRLELAMCLNVSEQTWTRVFSTTTLRRLRQLSLIICSVTDHVAYAIGKQLIQLEKICLSGCMGLGPSGVEAIVKGCSRLQDMQLLFIEPNMRDSLLLVPIHLPALRKLSIISYTNALDGTMSEIHMRMPDLHIVQGDPRWSDFFTTILQLTDIPLEIF